MRILADSLLFVATLFLPWWLVLPGASVLFFFFGRFYELFLVAFFMDLLYGISLERFWNFQFILSVGAVLLFLLFSVAKRRMRI